MQATVIILLLIFFLLFAIWWFEPRALLYLFQRLDYPVYSTKMFLEPKSEYFEQIDLIEQNQALILDEVRQLLDRQGKVPKAHEVDKFNGIISNDDGPGWRTFYLKVYSGWFEQNRQLCPRISELFKDMDDVITIMISVMEPGNTIPPHEGKLQGFVRYQLPLLVPQDGTCRITVGNESLDYKTGESFIFDDINTHSVINHTSQHRVVLFLDIRKKSNSIIRAIDRFLMKLITLSPIFKRANVYLG